ncbi:hypothetical protein J6590_044384 [Homalodisca vitripennis]|nr:hypothetical protein J6590_044384 [Homalodisca vitripennis]
MVNGFQDWSQTGDPTIFRPSTGMLLGTDEAFSDERWGKIEQSEQSLWILIIVTQVLEIRIRMSCGYGKFSVYPCIYDWKNTDQGTGVSIPEDTPASGHSRLLFILKKEIEKNKESTVWKKGTLKAVGISVLKLRAAICSQENIKANVKYAYEAVRRNLPTSQLHKLRLFNSSNMQVLLVHVKGDKLNNC